MKIKHIIFTILALVLIEACSKSDDEVESKPLVNHANKGDMEKQLKGNAFQGYGAALDKGHNIADTLQQGADQVKAQEDLQTQ